MISTTEDPAVSMARRTLYGLREKDIAERCEGLKKAFCHYCGRKIIKKGAHWVNIDYVRRWVCVDCYYVHDEDRP